MSTHLDPALKALSERGLEHCLNVHQIHFAAGHNNADQLCVICAHARHALLQALSKESVFVVHRLENGQQTVLDVTRELLLDSPLQRMARHLGVLLADQLQLLVVALAQDHVKGALVRSDLQFTGPQQLGGIALG